MWMLERVEYISMVAKAFRVLIADVSYTNQWSIERIFNGFGCYCVCSVSSFDEVLSICRNKGVQIDLLVVNIDMATKANIDLVSFVKSSFNVRNVLMYHVGRLSSDNDRGAVMKYAPFLPGNSVIRDVLRDIELRS